MRNFSSVNADTYKSNRKQVFQVMQAAHCYSATPLTGDTHQGSLHGSLAASEMTICQMMVLARTEDIEASMDCVLA